MNEHLQRIKLLLDTAVKSGMMKDSESVCKLQESYEYLIALQHDFDQACDNLIELKKGYKQKEKDG